MQPSYIDRYANRDSLIHRIDPGVSVLGSLIFIAVIALTPISFYPLFVIYLAVLSCLILLSKVPVGFILKNSLTIIPFLFLVCISIPFIKGGAIAGSLNLGSLKFNLTYSGLLIFANVLVKSWLSVLTILLLSTTTKFNGLLKGLEKLKFPNIFILILSFMYRYIFVIMDELARIMCSVKSRSFGRRKWFFEYKTIGSLIGNLFLRSYERGERVYLAMLSRGFTGEIKNLE